MKRMVAPSILASDISKLSSEIELINTSEADFVHIDVMDGVFVPNMSFGFPIVEAVKKVAKKPLDVHLMIINPEKYIERYHQCGADIINIHYEVSTHLHRSIDVIKKLGAKAGVTLNPHTPVFVLENIIKYLDLVLIMSVNPGYGGQEFIDETYSKISALCELRERKNSKAWIEVDGGIVASNARSLYEAGVDILVAGTAVFRAPDPVKAISDLKNA